MTEIERLIAYDHWANGETLSALERASSPPPKAVSLMGHVLATEVGWLHRMGQKNDFATFWPALDVAGLRAAWRDDLPACWRAFFSDATLAAPARTISYVNSKGARFESRVGDVLTHVVLHSAYHRGQVATHLRAAALDPPLTDFVHATRTGVVA